MSILFMYMQLVFSSLRLHFYNIRIIYSIFFYNKLQYIHFFFVKMTFLLNIFLILHLICANLKLILIIIINIRKGCIMENKKLTNEAGAPVAENEHSLTAGPVAQSCFRMSGCLKNWLTLTEKSFLNAVCMLKAGEPTERLPLPWHFPMDKSQGSPARGQDRFVYSIFNGSRWTRRRWRRKRYPRCSCEVLHWRGELGFGRQQYTDLLPAWRT